MYEHKSDWTEVNALSCLREFQLKNRNTNTIFVKYQVPLDERFIYRFFRDKQTRVSDKQDDDAESVNSDDAMEALEMFAEKGARDLDFASAVEPDQKTGNFYFF